MAKASGPALFDLLDQEKVRTPEEIKPRRAATGSGGKPTPGTSAPRQADRERPLVLRAGDRQNEAATHANKAPERGELRPPFFEVDDDRVRLTLTSARAAIVVFTLLIALLAAFEMGRSRGQRGGFAQGFQAGRGSFTSETLSEIEAARSAPPSTEIIGSLLVETGAPAHPSTRADVRRQSTARPVQWIDGHTYVVAQGFRRGREADAMRAKQFLAEHGIETELIRYDSGDMQLITTRGFNRSDPAQRSLADQWLERVHTVGEAYFASGGGYRLDGYFATFKGDRW